jgi:hypothetical protein
MSGKRSALDALSAAEKAAVLDELLTARPDLREPAEAHAARLMKDAGRSAIADDVESALKWLDINELNTRAGYRPGFGYVNPAEAADEILDEALRPFLDDLQRRAGLGMASGSGAHAGRLPAAARGVRRPRRAGSACGAHRAVRAARGADVRQDLCLAGGPPLVVRAPCMG